MPESPIDSRRRFPRTSAFTLVELLVVIGMITVLIAMLIPVLSNARGAAREVVCQSNQKQLMTAFLAFAADHQESLPGNYWDSMYQQPDPQKRDWLIGDNPNQGNEALQILDAPQKGTIYRYLNDSQVYLCPTYDLGTSLSSGAGSNGRFDYAAFIVFSGAKVGQIKPQAQFSYTTGPLAGTTDTSVFTPIICEEEPQGGINGGNDEGGHCNSDRLGHYHRGGAFYATIDCSVHWFQEPLEENSWNWESQAPSGNWTSLGSVVQWGWWERQ